jgi:hypothetical protein
MREQAITEEMILVVEYQKPCEGLYVEDKARLKQVERPNLHHESREGHRSGATGK